MDGGEETHPLPPPPEPPSYAPTPAILASISAILTRHAVFLHRILLETPRVYRCTVPSSVFPPSLRPSPPDAYHRTSGRRVKYIASLVELLAGRLCSTVVFLPSRQASRKTCRRPSFQSPCGTVARVSYLIFRSPGALTSSGNYRRRDSSGLDLAHWWNTVLEGSPQYSWLRQLPRRSSAKKYSGIFS